MRKQEKLRKKEEEKKRAGGTLQAGVYIVHLDNFIIIRLSEGAIFFMVNNL